MHFIENYSMHLKGTTPRTALPPCGPLMSPEAAWSKTSDPIALAQGYCHHQKLGWMDKWSTA